MELKEPEDKVVAITNHEILLINGKTAGVTVCPEEGESFSVEDTKSGRVLYFRFEKRQEIIMIPLDKVCLHSMTETTKRVKPKVVKISDYNRDRDNPFPPNVQ